MSDETRAIVAVDGPATEDSFAGLRDFETVVPCEQGLALLKQFGKRSPSLFALAEKVGFIDPAHPGFKTNVTWLTLAHHYSCCES